MSKVYGLMSEGSDGGDLQEKFLWPYLREVLPSYEIFWERFVRTLTNRVYPGFGVDPCAFRREIEHQNKDLIQMAQAHYATFVTLGSIFLRIFKWPSGGFGNEGEHVDLLRSLHHDRFLDVYRLFGTLFDLIAELGASVHRIRVAAGIDEAAEEVTIEELDRRFQEWRATKYLKALEKHRDSGFPITFHVVNRGDPLGRVVASEISSELRIIREETATYRNLLHSAQPGQLWIDGTQLVPRPNKVSEYRLWSRMVSGAEKRETDFWPLEDAMRKHWSRTAKVLEPLWEQLLSKMEEVEKKPQYQDWILLREFSDSKPKEVLFEVPSASGLASLSGGYVVSSISSASFQLKTDGRWK